MRNQTQSNSDVSRAPIRPELVAAKLAAIRNFEFPEIQRQIEQCPRLVEMLWFLQAMSMRPGGLAKFTEELLAEFPDHIGTAMTRKAAGHEYSLEEKLRIWNGLDDDERAWIAQQEPGNTAELLSSWEPQDVAKMLPARRAEIDAALLGFDIGPFRELFRVDTLQSLPAYLFALCTDKRLGFDESSSGRDLSLKGVYYFADPIGAVVKKMAQQAAQIPKGLAMTDVAKRVFDTLDYALAERVMVRIEGDSRFGKTEALQAWCDMRPGLARLVRVPCDNSMRSFLRRIGEALGIDCSYGSTPSRLKERVEYVIEHGGLFLALDEGAFLLPQNYNASTAPTRLNWVRTEIVDRNLPLAVVVTPQSFGPGVDRFVKKTHYSIEQFFGRNFLTCRLPAALSEPDMIAVAQIHFPEMNGDMLGYVANEARLSQNYLQAVEAIAKLARWKAARANRRLGVKDVKAAVAEVLLREAPAAAAPAVPGMDEAPRARNRLSGLMQAPLSAASSRLKPAADAAAAPVNLPSRSLRGAGPGMAEADLVSADT